jgi:ATP-dependent Clp protease ATP-binding subunit ClpC
LKITSHAAQDFEIWSKAMQEFSQFSDWFSESGQRVMKQAVEESRRREHNFITPEHIFIVIAEVERPFFNEVMESLNVDPQVVINELDSKLAVPKQYTGKRIKLTDSTRELLTAGLRQARKGGRLTIEAYDLFQALFDDRNDRTSVRILRKFSAEPEIVLEKIASMRDRKKDQN